MISNDGNLVFPAEITVETREERCHRLIRRAGLHLVIVTASLLPAPAAVHDDTRSLLLGVGGLLLLRCVMNNVRPPLGVLCTRRRVHKGLHCHG